MSRYLVSLNVGWNVSRRVRVRSSVWSSLSVSATYGLGAAPVNLTLRRSRALQTVTWSTPAVLSSGEPDMSSSRLSENWFGLYIIGPRFECTWFWIKPERPGSDATSSPMVLPPIGFSAKSNLGASMNDRSTTWTCGKLLISLSRMRMQPTKDMSSSRIGRPAPAMPLPTRTVSTTRGLILREDCRTVRSCTSLGVKLTRQSITITSSSVSGMVRTLSTMGALVPSVKVVSRSESRNGGQFSASTASTLSITVAESTGS